VLIYQKGLMMSADLSAFFRPHGVAVIGASRDPLKLGHAVVRNLIDCHYGGGIYPVNPRAESVLEHQGYISVKDVPDPVDLAIVIVPAQHVEAALIDCGERGIQCVTVASGGFREIGPEGQVREDALKRVAAQYGIAVIGPNCIGTIDGHTPLNATFIGGLLPRAGDIAFLSQSGAMAAGVIDWARGSGVGFSRVVSLGNQAVTTESEVLGMIGNDGITKVIAGYMEGVSNGRDFLNTALRVTPQLPVVILKAGRGKHAAQAIASHTGALAGDQAAYEAAFRRAGVLQAHTMEELFDWALALAWQPLPQGKRVAILTNAGGAGIVAVDAMEEAGLQLATITPQTKEYLRQRVFASASVENPVDILAGSGPATYALCLDALLNDEAVDAVVVIQAPQDWFAPVSLAEVIGEVSASSAGRRKPVLSVLMGLASTSEATQVLHRRRIPNFAFPERIASTLAAMSRRREWLDQYKNQTGIETLSKIDQKAGGAALHHQQGWLGGDQVEALLSAYGIPTPRTLLAADGDQAASHADSLGYPVVIKLDADNLTHKSDVGGVVLNLRKAAEVREAGDELIQRVRDQFPESVVRGVIVQPMLKGGAELIAGVVRDPQFGPLVMVGVGGVMVELARDVAFELAPLTRAQADAMLDRTGAHKLLAGFRGAPPADRAAVVEVILRLAQIAVDHESIQEIEINPVLAMPAGQGVWAVDARVRLA
jgi:acetyltransferase